MEAFALAPVHGPSPIPGLRRLAAVRAAHRHRRDPEELAFGICRACGRPWPCDTARLITAAVVAAQKETPKGTSVP
jgi:hypothetical protein